jgi:hypothetical protein
MNPGFSGIAFALPDHDRQQESSFVPAAWQ